MLYFVQGGIILLMIFLLLDLDMCHHQRRGSSFVSPISYKCPSHSNITSRMMSRPMTPRFGSLQATSLRLTTAPILPQLLRCHLTPRSRTSTSGGLPTTTPASSALLPRLERCPTPRMAFLLSSPHLVFFLDFP